MKVLILAAGYAVRLGELTHDTPKPLLSINNKKIIDRILDKISAVKGIGSIYVVTNNKFFEKFSDWRLESPYNKKITLINDGSNSNETRLGAIRDLEMAIEEMAIEEDLLVVAGDNLFDFDLNDFLKFAGTNRGAVCVALYDIKDLNAAKRFGVIKLDGHNRIIDFAEKPEIPKSTLVSTGVYYFPKNKLILIKKYVTMQDKKLDAPGYCISWLAAADAVYGFTFLKDWYDIGDIESFERANREYRKKESDNRKDPAR